MATIGFAQNRPPFRRGVSQARLKQIGVEQAITVTMTSGRRIFTGPSQPSGATTEELLEPIFQQALETFIDETIRANIQSLDEVINKMVQQLLPTVALDTGKLRNAMTGMLYEIRSKLNINQSILLAGTDNILRERNFTIVQLLIDFQSLFATVKYSVFHAVEFGHFGLEYNKPTTLGTKPYSIKIFFGVFLQNMNSSILDIIQLLGWDISGSSGTNEIILDSIGERGRLPG